MTVPCSLAPSSRPKTTRVLGKGRPCPRKEHESVSPLNSLCAPNSYSRLQGGSQCIILRPRSRPHGAHGAERGRPLSAIEPFRLWRSQHSIHFFFLRATGSRFSFTPHVVIFRTRSEATLQKGHLFPHSQQTCHPEEDPG